MDIPSEHHIPVELPKSKPFQNRNTQKITFDRKSCQRNDTSMSFDILASYPEPFVWLDINFHGGDFADNLVWLTEPRTTVTLELTDGTSK